MISIDEAIQYLLSDECKSIELKKTNILDNRTILNKNNIKTLEYNIIECFLFYLKQYSNIDFSDSKLSESFLKFFKNKIMEKNFIKSLKIDFPINKQLYLRSINNNLNDCFGILFISEYFNINTIISVNENNFIITDNKDIDIYKPYIILIYYPDENIYLPTFEFGSNDLSINHEEFLKILNLEETFIVNINLRNVNTKITSLKQFIQNQEEDKISNSDNSLIDSESSDDIDDEVKVLISKTDVQLMKEKKAQLLTILGRLKLYKKGYEKKKKADLVTIIRTYNN